MICDIRTLLTIANSTSPILMRSQPPSQQLQLKLDQFSCITSRHDLEFLDDFFLGPLAWRRGTTMFFFSNKR